MKKYIALLSILVLAVLIVPFGGIEVYAANIDPDVFKMAAEDGTVQVLVQLSAEPVVQSVTYNGKFSTTSEEIMKPNNIARNLVLSTVKMQQNSIMKSASMMAGVAVGPSFQYVYNGFTAKAKVSSVYGLSRIPGVKKIWYLKENVMHRIRSKTILGAAKVWNEVKDPSGNKVDGSNILCAVTDTGLDYTHDDFGNQKNPVGKKVVISHDFGEGDDDCQEIEDVTSHGTACAGLVAADGPGQEKGMAPKALLAGYKTTDTRGRLSGPAIMMAFEYLVKEKINVSSNSYGTAFGRANNYEAEVVTNAILADCSVLASQGNEGSPGPMLPYPAGNWAAPNSSIGVGATDDTDASSLIIDDTDFEDVVGTKYIGEWGPTGKTFNEYNRSFEVVDCGWGRPEDFKGINVKGKIALIQRGPAPNLVDQYGTSVFFKDKNLNAAKAGAKMMLLYNYELGPVRASYAGSNQNDKLDPNLIPAFHIFKDQGELIKDTLHRDHEWELGKPDADQNKVFLKISPPTPRANCADFTSAGPTTDGYLKPDISAPGVGIHTSVPAWESEKSGSKYTDQFSGTSAACPLAAGCVALIRQGRPEWDPLEIKRAVMNTATVLTRFTDDRYVPLTIQGQGRINVHEAITSQLLFQPPSGLIVASTKQVNCADWPEEVLDSNLRSDIPQEARNSMVPIKIYNYDKKDKKISISYTINARYPEDITVDLSTTEITVPKAVANKPSFAWLGVNINVPSKVRGLLNDVFIWATDRSTGKKWHVGFCIYSDNPRTNTYASDITIDTKNFEPDGDGVNEVMKIDYTLTNGKPVIMSGLSWDMYNNYAEGLTFWAIDLNSERWVKIFGESFTELGPHSFTWDGKDENGNYVLPEGDWYIQVTADGSRADLSQRAFVPYSESLDLFRSFFTVAKSTVPQLPTLSAFTLPIEPGVGQEFEVIIYVKYAVDIKTVAFQLDFTAAEGIARYLGYEVGDFMKRGDENLLVNVEPANEQKTKLNIDIQRAVDGMGGEGYLLKLRFIAESQNVFDVNFAKLQVTRMYVGNDNKMSEIKAKAFYKRSEISVYREPFVEGDFNKDGKVDEKDLDVIKDKLGAKRGEPNYFWRCDLNYDGVIDMNDFSIFAKNYLP